MYFKDSKTALSRTDTTEEETDKEEGSKEDRQDGADVQVLLSFKSLKRKLQKCSLISSWCTKEREIERENTGTFKPVAKEKRLNTQWKLSSWFPQSAVRPTACLQKCVTAIVWGVETAFQYQNDSILVSK